MDASELLPFALRRQVAFVPGEEFHLNGMGKNTLRLNFSHPSPDRIQEGLQRLAQVYLSGSSQTPQETGLFP